MCLMLYAYAHRRHPRDPDLAGNLALALQRFGRFDEALQVLQPLVDAGSEAPHLWANRADLLRRLGRPGEAEQAYRRWLELAGEDIRPAVELARLLIEQDRLDEAESLLVAAHRERPDSVDACFLLASHAARAGDRIKVRQWLRRLRILVPAPVFEQILELDRFRGITVGYR
jgi:predicted Zn-dependent protease